MRLFIWQYLAQVSDNYHSGGGLAVIAEDLDHARALIERTDDVEVLDDEWAEVITFAGIESDEERIFVFPDAGCC